MLEDIKRTDIKDKKEFTIQGDKLVQLEEVDPVNRIYVYGRYTSSGVLYAYEVVKGVRYKDSDGSIIYMYPSSEMFGSKGYFLPARCKDEIPEYVSKLQRNS